MSYTLADRAPLLLRERENSLRKPIIFFSRHGVVSLEERLLTSGLEPRYYAERLETCTSLMVGRSASNHDLLAFSHEADMLLVRLSTGYGYRQLTFRFDI